MLADRVNDRLDRLSMGGTEEVWVPVTLHLPIGFAKSWNPGYCAPVSFMCGPYAIILLAQARPPPGRPAVRLAAGAARSAARAAAARRNPAGG